MNDMANVWKIGSRWSPDGSYESRIISIFRRSEAVFIGSNDSERFNKEVKEGDYFAIADGFCIPAVAKAISNPMPLNDMIAKKIIKVRKKDPFDISDDFSGCYGVKVKIVDLPSKDIINYEKRGAFCEAKAIAEKVVKLYEDNLSHQFDIQAHTYRIKSLTNADDGKRAIIDQRTIFNIPVYQREYSWEEEQVRRFVGDIFKGFWGSEAEKRIIREPMFIGTMQLSYKKYIIEDEYEQDVIDGQQRLTTILCIIKYLQLKYKQNEIISKLDLNWLETRVNNGKEDDCLRQVLAYDCLDAIMNEQDECNRYLKNIQIIKGVFEEETSDEEGNVLSLFRDNFDSFIEYFLTDIYFVVVETLAGLSKTIQIFNTINTAGLELNGNDLFKVRFYEYLHDKKGYGEEAFNEIGEIYKEVKDINSRWRKNHDWDIISMELIRSIYKDYIISKYKLSVGLYNKSTDTFFEELFDTLLNVKSHRDMNGVKGKDISLLLEDLRRIMKVALLWGKSEFKTHDEFISYTLIERSRYSRYINIAYQILLSNESLSEEERLSHVYEYFSWLSKLFFCYSIMYAKAVNEMHSFMHSAYRLTYDYQNQKDSLISKIKEKLNMIDKEWSIDTNLGGAIAYNRIWKNLICIISDYFNELENKTSISELQQLYSENFDIEHIHANGNEEEGLDIDEELQNGIGNLMLLEYDINRSIGSLPFREKVNRQDGKLCYKDSKYATVKKIRTFKKWELEEVKQRRKEEIERICNFLFDKL